MSLTHSPIDDDEFAAALRAVGLKDARPVLGVAVSGGADSTALAILASRFAAARGGRILAYTVDHGMRPGSAEEALAVSDRLARRGIEGRILVWSDGRPGLGHARARDARLRLLVEAADRDGVENLLLAQHADDQVETVLMRLSKGSGAEGLAGIPVARRVGAVRLLRPLLDSPKARLIATCLASGLEWVEDPSNLDLRFERGRIRRRLGPLVGEGSEVRQALLDVAAAASRLRTRLDAILSDVEGVARYPHGYAEIEVARLADLPSPIGRRLLAGLVAEVGGAVRSPGEDATDRLLSRILDPSIGGPTTLGRVRAIPTGGVVRLVREARNLPSPMPTAGEVELFWDRRLRLTVQAPSRGASVRRLTKGEAVELSRRSAVPVEVAETLPCIDAGEAGIVWPDVETRNKDPRSGKVQSLVVEWMPASAGGRTSTLFGRFGALSSGQAPLTGSGKVPNDVRSPA